MKNSLIIIFTLCIAGMSFAQSGDEHQSDIQTIFKSSRVTGYGAITNKFTSIRGEYANVVGGYGGVFINRTVMLGLGGFATTNAISVPDEFKAKPGENLSYGYVQTGLMSEWVLASNKPVHLVLSMFAGAGYSFQYEHWTNPNYEWDEFRGPFDQNWFFVAEPGAELEVNLFRWMRMSPGISYRKAFNSSGLGLSDDDISDWTYSFTLKFGKF